MDKTYRELLERADEIGIPALSKEYGFDVWGSDNRIDTAAVMCIFLMQKIKELEKKIDG